MGVHDQAQRHHERALELARDAGDRMLQAAALNNLGVLHRLMGFLRKLHLDFGAALDLCRAEGDEQRACIALGNLGDNLVQLGEYDAARTYIDEAHDVSIAVGNSHLQAWARRCRASILEASGDPASALAVAQLAIESARRGGDRLIECEAVETMALAHVTLGDHERAGELFATAHDIARELGDHGMIVDTLEGRGRALAATDPGSAIDLLGQAHTLARRHGMRLREAKACLALADVHEKAGDAVAARDRLENALRLCEEIDDPRAETIRARLAAA